MLFFVLRFPRAKESEGLKFIYVGKNTVRSASVMMVLRAHVNPAPYSSKGPPSSQVPLSFRTRSSGLMNTIKYRYTRSNMWKRVDTVTVSETQEAGEKQEGMKEAD